MCVGTSDKTYMSLRKILEGKKKVRFQSPKVDLSVSRIGLRNVEEGKVRFVTKCPDGLGRGISSPG